MGKRKSNKAVESKRKKAKQDQDALLSSGIFASGTHEDISDVEDWDNEEQDYELQPRSVSKQFVETLPIKKADGTIERKVREVKQKEEEPEETKESEPTQKEEEDDEEFNEEEEDEDSHLSPEQKLINIKEEVASLASKLIEDPEENILCLTRLRKMSESKNFVTSQLSILALIPVFKSLAPSYNIRPLTDAEKKEKVSKDVAKLRSFEQSLIFNYHSYVKNLTSLSKVSYSNSLNNKKITSNQIKQGQTATKAACELCLSSLRYFNFRTDLFNILIRRLNRKPQNESDLKIFLQCITVLETLLKDDERNGDISFDVVKLLCKSIKDKKFRVDESVLNIFLSLSLLLDYDPNNEKPQQNNPKIKKKDRVHLSKKERKQRKERKEIDEELRKAEQAITAEQRENFQAQTLKTLLTLYLEILKAGGDDTTSASALTAAVLEGLSRFGQMANFDLLGDFLQVLREIMTDMIQLQSLKNNDIDDDEENGGLYSGKQIRTILLCIATSFALILNHSTVGRIPISIDLTKFISNLYVILADLCLDPDLELNHKTLRLADPLGAASYDKPSVNVSTKSELLLRCLDHIFFNSKNGSLPRATAFAKRLYILTLHTPEKTSLATLKFVGKLMSRYGEGFKSLWSTEDTVNGGEGQYMLGYNAADEVELERSNSEAATLWENVLLDKHFSPIVRDGSRSLMKNSKHSVERR